MAYVSAIEEARKAYATGGIEAVQKAYSDVVKTKSETTPTPTTSTPYTTAQMPSSSSVWRIRG